MNAYELADQVEMWGEDLLALNMKGGIPVVQGAKMLRHQADYIDQLEKGLESSIEMNKAQAERFAELERKHKEEFDYAERLVKERDK